MRTADAATQQSHSEKSLLLQYQRSNSSLSHLETDLNNMRALTESQQQKLTVLLELLAASKQQLESSITQKSSLLDQTREAAVKMCEICEQTLREEQSFFEQQDHDKMYTAPYIDVKRRERP